MHNMEGRGANGGPEVLRTQGFLCLLLIEIKRLNFVSVSARMCWGASDVKVSHLVYTPGLNHPEIPQRCNSDVLKMSMVVVQV